MNKFIETLKEHFGDMEFEHIILKYTDKEVVFLTVSDAWKDGMVNVEVWTVSVSEESDDIMLIQSELSYTMARERNSSILTCVHDVLMHFGGV